MSNWTHVAGIARINASRCDNAAMDFDRIFGKELNYDDETKIWDEYYRNPELFLPAGREGSLHKSVWVNPDISHLAAYTVSIFGDLRDHDSPSEIVDWFKEKLENFWVRNATITVENEWNGTVNWTYERK